MQCVEPGTTDAPSVKHPISSKESNLSSYSPFLTAAAPHLPPASAEAPGEDSPLITGGTSLEAGVNRVFERQKVLGTELAEVRAQISEFTASTSRLGTAVNRLETTALTFGDIQGYLGAIEGEMTALQRALQRIQAQKS
jgi:GCN5-like protein 1 (GCN5L1)